MTITGAKVGSAALGVLLAAFGVWAAAVNAAQQVAAKAMEEMAGLRAAEWRGKKGDMAFSE